MAKNIKKLARGESPKKKFKTGESTWAAASAAPVDSKSPVSKPKAPSKPSKSKKKPSKSGKKEAASSKSKSKNTKASKIPETPKEAIIANVSAGSSKRSVVRFDQALMSHAVGFNSAADPEYEAYMKSFFADAKDNRKSESSDIVDADTLQEDTQEPDMQVGMNTHHFHKIFTSKSARVSHDPDESIATLETLLGGKPGRSQTLRLDGGLFTIDSAKFLRLVPCGPPQRKHAQFIGPALADITAPFHGKPDYSVTQAGFKNTGRRYYRLPEKSEEIVFMRYIGRWCLKWAAGEADEGNENDLGEAFEPKSGVEPYSTANYKEKMKYIFGQKYFKALVKDFDNLNTKGYENKFPYQDSIEEYNKNPRLLLAVMVFLKVAAEKGNHTEFMNVFPWPLGRKDPPESLVFGDKGFRAKIVDEAAGETVVSRDSTIVTDDTIVLRWKADMLRNKNMVVAYYLTNLLNEWNNGHLVFTENNHGIAEHGYHLIKLRNSVFDPTKTEQIGNWLTLGGENRKSWGWSSVVGWASAVLYPNNSNGESPYDLCMKHFDAGADDFPQNSEGCHRQCNSKDTVKLPQDAMKRILSDKDWDTQKDRDKESLCFCVALGHVFPGSKEINVDNIHCGGTRGMVGEHYDNQLGDLGFRYVRLQDNCKCHLRSGNPGRFKCRRINWLLDKPDHDNTVRIERFKDGGVPVKSSKAEDDKKPAALKRSQSDSSSSTSSEDD